MPEMLRTEPGRRKWLRRYIQLVVIAGAGFVLAALIALPATAHPFQWLLFAALAVLTGSFSLKVASVYASVTVSDTFFITTALLFGPAPATLAVALDTVIVSWRRGHRPEVLAFNTATSVIGTWIGSHAFFLLAGVQPLATAEVSPALLIFPLLGFAALYYTLNSGLVAVAIGLEAKRSPLEVWRQHFLFLSLNYFAAASVAFCLVLLIHQVSLGAVVVILPLLAVLHLTLRSSFGRLEDARRHLAHLDRLYLSTVETLAMAIDAKDDVTHSHVRRVQTYSLGLARALGVSDEPTLKAIEAAALLHDTGKLAVPEFILNKPGKLSKAEFEQMKRHVDIGADILSLVDFPFPVVPIVRCHHENWDGSGYPRGVKAEEIPIGARILSVVDCFDALTSDRPYRSAMTDAQAFDILRERSGGMYEPRIVETFIRVHPELVGKIVDRPGHRDVMQRISEAVTPKTPHAPAAAPAAAASDEVLAFVSLGRLAAGDGSVGDVLGVASTLMSDLAPDATIAWYLMDDNSGRLVATEVSGAAAALVQGTCLGMGEGLSGWVAANRQTIVNSEAALDLGDRAEHLTPPLQSCLSVPLIARELLVGAVTLYAAGRAAFTEDQRRLIELIAPHIAHGIWAARSAKGPAAAAFSSKPSAASSHELRLVAAR